MFQPGIPSRGSPQASSYWLALLVAFLLSLCTAPAHAATYYVATNGSDSASGSESAPWKTIRYAVSRMNAGDTTYVRGGVYNETGNGVSETSAVWFSRSGTASAPIRLLNAPGESPVIDCRNIKHSSITFKNSASYRNPIGHITIEGFEIRNCYVGIKMYSGHDIIIRRNWIHDAQEQGILGNGKNILIDRNVINHVGNFERCASGGRNSAGTSTCILLHAIYGTGTNWAITNNLIYDNLSYGIVVAGYPKCEHSGCKYIKRYPDDSYGGADNWLIANNTIAYQHYRAGIVLWQGLTTNAKIINNIFYENSQKYSGDSNGISFVGSGGGHIIQNNICYATAPGGTACIGANGAGKYTGSNNITANPNFEGAGATISGVPNFKLKPGSPAIDKGQSLSQVTWDHAGGKRPHGAAFDIGAYEFGSPPDSGSPPPNPTGGDFPSGFPSGIPILRGPNGEICPSGFLPAQ